MKKHIPILSSLILCLIFSLSTFDAYGEKIISAVKGLFDTSGQKGGASNPEELYDLTLDENLMQPDVGKYAELIKAYQKKQAIAIKRAGYKTELTRHGEVIIVSVPAGELFIPEDSILTDNGKRKLKYFEKFLATPDFYHILLVMHSDNTGIQRYTYNLSKTRVEKILDNFELNDYVIPYAMGATMPLVPNNSLTNRYSNRRLEIYLVPGIAMIEQAKKGTLNF